MTFPDLQSSVSLEVELLRLQFAKYGRMSNVNIVAAPNSALIQFSVH